MPVSPITKLLSKYENVKIENKGLLVRDEQNPRQNDGICIAPSDSKYARLRSMSPVYLTYEPKNDCFVAEQKRFISYEELYEIVSDRSYYDLNKDYPNIVKSSYLDKEFENDIKIRSAFYVYGKIRSLLDSAARLFLEYDFPDNELPRSVELFPTSNIYLYPQDIKNCLDDEEERFVEKEKNEFFERLDASKQVAKNLVELEDNSSLSEKELEDLILTNIYKLYDKDYNEAREWARDKCGFGIGGDISINEDDWESMQTSWEIIKSKHPNIFRSSRFIPLSCLGDEEKSKKSQRAIFLCLDKFFKSTDLGSIFLKLFNLVHNAFYGKSTSD